jgi:hypothetical protein
MGGNNSSQSFDQLKRAFLDLVNELHSRKLAIPAGAVLVAILAAVFLLPKSPAPPAPVAATPVANQQQTVNADEVVKLKMVGVSSLDNGDPISHSSDPFEGKAGTKCVRIGSGTPKRFACRVGDQLMLFECLPDVEVGICAPDTGASGATGAVPGTDTGGGGGGATPPTGDTTPKKKKHVKKTYFEVSVSIDGRTYTHVIAGDSLPNDANTLAVYAGATTSGKKAIFISGDGVTITGAVVDEELGNFELSKGQTVTITDKLAAQHTLTLKSITKVTK